MIVKMLYQFVAFSCIFGSVLGNGEFVVFHGPPSVKFLGGTKTMPADLVSDVVLASLGFTTPADSQWPGLVRISPFDSARLAVIYSLDGPSARLPGEVTSRATSVVRYALTPMPGEGPATWFAELKGAAAQRGMLNATASLEVLDAAATTSETDGLDVGSLDPKVEEDKAWLREMQSLRAIIQKASTGDLCSKSKGPGVLWLESTALHALSDLHGAGSVQAKDASKMLGSILAGINQELQTACNDRVLFAAVTSDATHTRRTRSLLQEKPKADPNNPYNLSKSYDKNYSVMFTIFLIFGIAFVFVLIAISIAIASMDPGRDSIIYRMTNTRMKKDN